MISYNATIDLLERNLNAERADRNYFFTETRPWSYDEIISYSRSFSCGLFELGLLKGDRVVLVMRDRPEFAIAFWGTMRAGLVPVLVPPSIAPAELDIVLRKAVAETIVFDMANKALVEEVSVTSGVQIKGIQVEGTPSKLHLSWSDICSEASNIDATCTTETDVAFLICSSGTTGTPKLIAHLHGGLRRAAEGLGKQIIGLSADDIVLSVSKMCFSYGLGNSLYTPAIVGASTVLVDAPAIPAIVQSRLMTEHVTVLYGVPSFLRAYLADPKASTPNSLRMILSAGEKLDPLIADEVNRRFGIAVLDGYGMTETLQHVTCNRSDEVVMGSCGAALDGFEIEVRNADGMAVAEGERGELWIAGRTLFDRYWGEEDLTRRTRIGRWMRTGDVVRLREGHLFHEGRLDDLIKLGGRWVSPIEIEELLRSHADLHDVAVIPRSDPTGFDWICGLIVTDRDEEALEDELIAFCSKHLTAYKIPREWIRVEALPRTPTGKLLRSCLGEMLKYNN